MDDVQARRLAQNETIFRQVNEYVRRADERVPHEDEPRFVCECSSLECDAELSIPLEHYRATREDPTRFFVVPGHADSRIERVIETPGDYEVVEKIGPGRDVAEQDAP